MPDFENIDVVDVKAGDVILDVREQDEWDAGHIDGAVHIPLGELPLRLQELDPDTDYRVMCLRGGRSAQAAQWLTAQGYSVVNVRGGMQQWAQQQLPIVSDHGEPYVKGH